MRILPLGHAYKKIFHILLNILFQLFQGWSKTEIKLDNTLFEGVCIRLT